MMVLSLERDLQASLVKYDLRKITKHGGKGK